MTETAAPATGVQKPRRDLDRAVIRFAATPARHAPP